MTNTNTNAILNVNNNEYDVVNVYHFNRANLKELAGGVQIEPNGRSIQYQVKNPQNGANAAVLKVGVYYTSSTNVTTVRLQLMTWAVYTAPGSDTVSIRPASFESKMTLPGQATEWFDSETGSPQATLTDLIYNGISMWWPSATAGLISLEHLKQTLQGLPQQG